MFEVRARGQGFVTADELVKVIEGIGDIVAEALADRDEKIRKLQADLETERRLRLSMKSK